LVGRFVGVGVVVTELLHRPFEPQNFEQHDASPCPVLKHTYPST